MASRGVVSHEAKSQLRLYRDAAGCESVQAVNRGFKLVTVVTDSGPNRLVLEEAYDIRHCLTAESASYEATVTAWRPDSGAAQPLFRINGRGTEGRPSGNLYGMSTHGCCGSRDLTSYFSLITGSALFASSVPLLRLDGGHGPVRFAAFHDTFSAGTAGEAATDSTVIGVLQWGDDRRPAQRFLVRAERPEAFAAGELVFRKNGRAVADTSVLVNGTGAPKLALGLLLVAPGSGRTFQLEVPIKGLELDPVAATVPRGLRLTPVR